MATNTLLLLVAILLQLSSSAPVRLYVFDYIDPTYPLQYHPVQRIETGETFNTTYKGEVELDIPVGQNVTFIALDHNGFHVTQTATVTVPAEGLNTLMTEMVLQVPDNGEYNIYSRLTPGKKQTTGVCQFTLTVCNVNKTWSDFPQGLEGTVVHLDPPLQTQTFYFGTWGWFSNRTNPLPNHRTTCSWDGGVLFENVPIRDEPYIVTAERDGYTFSETVMFCRTERFVNAAPNQGPRARLNNPY